MLKNILYCIEKLLIVVLVMASGLGFFLAANFVVLYVWGEEYLRIPAEMVFFLGGLWLSIGLVKLLEIIQYEELHIRAAEIEAEMGQDEKAVELFEHLRVK